MSTTYENDEKTFSLCAINLRSSFEAGFCLVQRSICLIKRKSSSSYPACPNFWSVTCQVAKAFFFFKEKKVIPVCGQLWKILFKQKFRTTFPDANQHVTNSRELLACVELVATELNF